ncbi:MAG: 50S ribosomal protein L21 [Candidatus Spechtbacteria bacterium RIFCSPLOWO2_12_FULL_38_22]|uniref:Large ribosomal subunit protein bL21 n=1 Tax=Candidatus Spechtbacteria bacterium RIFCSPLOWO2_12_FULL_38_22 TaxID=1802165 RepID=A0A1G2HH13_9BACT|nr:MAG: 50S ribosomal protein L21 [Candidatus Spechtbacteria bacterium RIFCSPLOWO2_12_FULL_38_22]
MSDKLAVIKTGGKQYKVSEGDKIRVEKLSKEEGSVVSFPDVLLYVDGENVDVGTPTVSGVSVEGKVLGEGKADKVVVFKYKKRKRYSKKKGHRQQYTQVEITTIRKGASIASKSSNTTSAQVKNKKNKK